MTKRALILVEGQTEERFVKDVLAPSFWPVGLYIEPTLLVTKRVKDGSNFKGGVTNFSKFKSDINRLINGSRSALVTTFIDYYGLPMDFPGMTTRPLHSSNESCVSYLEKKIAQHFGNKGNFLPFFMLHEFETLLFSNVEVLPRVMTSIEKTDDFSAIRDDFDTPEDINDNPETAPSKRIVQLFPGYRKTLHGPNAARRIGLDVMRSECPHFAKWMTQLETFAVA